MPNVKHFLSLFDLSTDELNTLIHRAIELKAIQKSGKLHTPLQNKVLAMIFEKSSTRTRLSFETGMVQLGGHAIFMSPQDTQIGRGEPIEDTARVTSSMVDGIMIRTFAHEKAVSLASYSSVPVINGLTDLNHPCQLLADMQTYQEARGSIKSATVAWIGDGNNMCHSYINAAKQFGFTLNIACPAGYEPSDDVIAKAQANVNISHDPELAAKNADLITTDVWASMGKEEEQNARIEAFTAYQVNQHTMQLADKDAIFLHCLPAHRDEEVSADVIDGKQSLVWQQAENRLHAQKALLELLLS